MSDENAIQHADEIESSADEAKAALAKVDTVSGVDLLTIGKAFAASGYFPDAKSQAQAVTKILAGHELDVPPVAAMQGFHCIPRRRKVGKEWVEEVELSMSANLRAAIIKRSDRYDYRVVELTDEACEVEVASLFAGEWSKATVRITREEMSRAKVPAGGGETRPLTDGHMWKQYPADMLFAAEMRRVARRFCADLFIGEPISSDEEDLRTAEQTVALEQGEVIDGEVEHSEFWDQGGADTAPSDPQTPEPSEGDASPYASDPSEEPPVAKDESEPPPPDDTDAEHVTHVGLLAVPRAEGEFKPAEKGELRTADQVTALHHILKRLNLTEGALDAVCKARFDGVPLAQLSRKNAEELGTWLQRQQAHVKARAGTK